MDERQVPAGHVAVSHGKLLLTFPRSLFQGPDLVAREPEMSTFLQTVRSRYPWLSENALKVIVKNARRELERVIWEEKKGSRAGRELMESDLELSIAHLQRHLHENPEDADAWYVLGESLCRAGRQEEGYQAFQRGRRLSGL